MKTDKKKKEKKFIWKKGLIILFWLMFWQILAWVIDNKILLEGPIGVLTYLVKDIQTIEYYRTVCASLIRIMSGVLSGAILAIAFGSLLLTLIMPSLSATHQTKFILSNIF